MSAAAHELQTEQETSPKLLGPWRRAAIFKQLGPGLVTGAADDDPSGIATYSQAGAQFGYNMLWTMLFTYPLMTAIQLVSGKIGRVTGCGLTKNLSRILPKWMIGELTLENDFLSGALGKAGLLGGKK